MLLTVVWIAFIGWQGNERLPNRYHPIGDAQIIVFTPHPSMRLTSGDVSSDCSGSNPVRHELPTAGMPEAGPMTLLVFCEDESRESWANQFTRADELVKAVRELVARHDEEENQNRVLRIGSFILTLAFPVGILLIAMLLRWIVRGFRRTA